MSMENNELSTRFKYKASFIPAVSVLVLLILFSFIKYVFGVVQLPKVDFDVLIGLPFVITLEEYRDISVAGVWWLLSTYFFWVVALLALLMCFFVIYRSLSHLGRQTVKLNMTYLVGLLALMGVGIFFLNKYVAPIISAQDLIRHINIISSGAKNLVMLTQGVAIAVIMFLFVTTGYILIPEKNRQDIIRKVKLTNLTLYTGAVVLVAWLLQSRLLYHFSATLLEQEQKLIVQSVAPTVSLAVGALFSIFLFVMYISAIIWLQYRHALIKHGVYKNKNIFEYLTDEKGPAKVIYRHFSRVLALMLPLFPGLIEFIAAP